MEWLTGINWEHLLVPDTPLLEIFVRGTLMYLGLFFLMRVILKRQSGSVGVTDLLVVVLIADAAQNGMADDYQAIPDGLLLVATILFWCFLLDWVAYYVPQARRFIEPRPLPLIENGRLLQRNMRREFLTREELMSHLREEGVESIADVKEACMESDGKISVVRKK